MYYSGDSFFDYEEEEDDVCEYCGVRGRRPQLEHYDPAEVMERINKQRDYYFIINNASEADSFDLCITCGDLLKDGGTAPK